MRIGLNSLTSVEGLVLPKIIKGSWYLNSITKEQFNALNYSGEIKGHIYLTNRVVLNNSSS